LYKDEPSRFRQKLEDGDDFAFWSVWFGCVVFDSGVFRKAVEAVAMGDFWPDPDRKIRQAEELLRYAEAFVGTGDYPMRVEYWRPCYSTVAGRLLFWNAIFPLARGELAGHLREVGSTSLADALDATIHSRPFEAELKSALGRARDLIAPPRRAAA